ncbi:MAG TPA: hypothetical protein VLU25_01005 [Acidobacteriota bacterium]|nr:hypothetical protein [Acidobacteriota bacterium]
MLKRSLALLGTGLLLLLLTCRSASPNESEVGALPPVTADDLEPVYLTTAPPESQLAVPHISTRNRIALQLPSGRPPLRRVSAFTSSPDSLYLLEWRTNTIWQFDDDGTFIRRFGHAQSGERVIEAGYSLHYSEKKRRIFVADNSGTLVYHEDGEFDRVIEKPQYSYSVAETPEGQLLVCSSTLQGPHWVRLGEAGSIETFYSRRRPLLPPGQEHLSAFVPHSYADADSQGNIYIGAKVPYQIRKYASDLSYLGDFRLIPDPTVVDPPERLSPEEWEARMRGQTPTHSAVHMLSVIQNRYVVTQILNPDLERRLHIYTLDGEQAFQPISWPYYFLGANYEGFMTFLDNTGDELALVIGRLEGDGNE